MVGAQPDRDRLATDHLELVGQIVAEVSVRYPRHVDRGELWNAGALGLVEASRRFDPKTGIPFPRYASIRIRGAIIDSTRTRDWATRSVRRRLREIDQAVSDHEERNGKRPDEEELAGQLGITPQQLTERKAQATYSTLLHLDQEDAEELTLKDQVRENRLLALPEEALEHKELLGTLRSAIEYLPEIQADVVRRYYLNKERLQEIAADLGITEARVSQIRSEALASMRSYFSTLYEGLPTVPNGTPGKRARSTYLALLDNDTDWRSRLEAPDAPDSSLAV